MWHLALCLTLLPPDAGLCVVLLDGRGNDTSLVAGEGAGDDVGNPLSRPFLPLLPDCVLCIVTTPQQPQLGHGNIGYIPLKKACLCRSRSRSRSKNRIRIRRRSRSRCSYRVRNMIRVRIQPVLWDPPLLLAAVANLIPLPAPVWVGVTCHP